MVCLIDISNNVEFARKKGSVDKTFRKRRTYLGVVKHDAGKGAQVGAGLGVLGSATKGATLLATKEGRDLLSGGTSGGRRKTIMGASLALGTGLGGGIGALQGGILGAGVGAVRAPFRKKDAPSR